MTIIDKIEILLLPCPCCLSKPEIICDVSATKETIQIKCRSAQCSIQTAKHLLNEYNKQWLIRVWNTRKNSLDKKDIFMRIVEDSTNPEEFKNGYISSYCNFDKKKEEPCSK